MYTCDRCDRFFTDERAYERHVQTSARHHVCRECNQDFTSWQGRKRHWVRSPAHHYCEQCDRHFGDRTAYIEHSRTAHHYCETCDLFFGSDNKLHRHHLQSHADRYCVECRRSFVTPNNFEAASGLVLFVDGYLIFRLLALALQGPPGQGCRMSVVRQDIRLRRRCGPAS